MDKYNCINERVAFGFLVNALGGKRDRGALFPYSDAEDMSRGLRFIPDDVTVARRLGETVTFEQPCHNPCCWYWQFPGGGRTYYWEREAYEQIAEANGIELNEDEFGTKIGEAGACPLCGNVHTSGGHIASP
jgi:hypothetical protein